MNDEGRQRRVAGAFRTFLLTLVAVLVLMYAIQATEINLEEPLEPQRQVNLVSLLRELARPDLFTYETEVRSTNISIRMPCPEEVRASQITVEGRQVTLSPNCATTTQDTLTLTGQGFPTNARGVIGWHPPGTTVRRLAEFRADSQGNFRVSFTMPDIRATAEPQRVEIAEVVSRRIVGFSETSETAVARIIETIFMALMASTIGTILAIPISFLAARNLMADVSAPLAAIMAALAALPIGGWLGGQAAGALVTLSAQVSQQAVMGLSALVLAVVLTWPVLRLGPPVLSDERRPPGVVTLSLLRLILAILLCLFGLGVLAHLGMIAGRWLEERLGFLGFLGNFVFVISDFMRITLPALMALIGAIVAASVGSRYGQEAAIRLAGAPARLLTAVLTAIGTAVLIYGLLYSLNWICLLGLCRVLPQDTLSLLTIPAVIGGLAGLLSLAIAPKRPIPIGFTIYNISRTILNALRAIEPVILGFVFVVWVGIGPFAGIMALTLHSIADLGKLFSEQVENIAEGPREAVRATGANQIQTIAYAVIPQIVPHYLAFIFYRWDINVRMSTIIGFVGGGGIGLALQRFANLTQYRQASVMIIAIAIVVAALDYISSRIRERII